MNGSRPRAAAERAQWLAELAEAISQAENLAWRLGYAEGNNADAQRLYARLVSLRSELESLRQNSWTAVSAELDPFWAKFLPRP